MGKHCKEWSCALSCWWSAAYSAPGFRLVDVDCKSEDGHRLVTVATPMRLRGGGDPPAVVGALVAALDVQTGMGDRALPYLKADLKTLANTLAPHLAGAARRITTRLTEQCLTGGSSCPAACPPAAGGARRCIDSHSRCSSVHSPQGTLCMLARFCLGQCHVSSAASAIGLCLQVFF